MKPYAYLDHEFSERGYSVDTKTFIEGCAKTEVIEDLMDIPGLSDFNILERAMARLNVKRRSSSMSGRLEWVLGPPSNPHPVLVSSDFAQSIRILQAQTMSLRRSLSFSNRALEELISQGGAGISAGMFTCRSN